jgi:DNA-binding HxlR family transcriptional regulator
MLLEAALAQGGTILSPSHTNVTTVAPTKLHVGCKEVAPVLARIGDKWSILVVMILAAGPRRFNELKRLVDGVSQRMLTLTLRNLERDGLVNRTMFPTIPPRVDYELTPLGHSLRVPATAFGEWVTENLGKIQIAREAFDSRED